jgi:hypothetical protein
MLSYLARIFDPLGLLSPALLQSKLLIQRAWLEAKWWDEEVHPDSAVVFQKYMTDLKKLNSLQIPRFAFTEVDYNLIAFCDASEKAYCVAIYVRSRAISGEINCRLLCSKTKVAPLKQLTIPRLELEAAKLLVTLLSTLAQILGLGQENCYAFSDSTVVLCWLSTPADDIPCRSRSQIVSACVW